MVSPVPDPKDLEHAFRMDVFNLLKEEGLITDMVIENTELTHEFKKLYREGGCGACGKNFFAKRSWTFFGGHETIVWDSVEGGLHYGKSDRCASSVMRKIFYLAGVVGDPGDGTHVSETTPRRAGEYAL
jgi:hypothetical protein